LTGPKRRSSGEIAAAAYRVKHDSVAENTLNLVKDLNERIEKVAERARVTPIPPSDPRVDPEEDPRRESSPMIDIVDLIPDTLPETRPRVPRPTTSKEKK
jgi:hypothetical protein